MTAPSLEDAHRVVAAMLATDSADARAGLGFLLREIATVRPDLLRREATRLDLQRLGLRTR